MTELYSDGSILDAVTKEVTMADRVVKETRTTEAPRDTVVVHDDRGDRRSNAPVVFAIIFLILLLLLLWGASSLFGGGGGGSTDINVQTPTPAGQ